MDMTARRRNGKGIGTESSRAETLPLADASDSETRREAEVQRPSQELDESLVLRRSEENQLAMTRGSSSVGDSVTVNPFWSARAQDEIRLQAARPENLGNPDFLGHVGVQRSGNSSTSTELRQAEPMGRAELTGPRGDPVVYGPPVLRTTVAEGVDTARASVTSQGASMVASAMGPSESVLESHEEGHGLSVRERNILTEMKNAMVRISQQNEQLASQNEALWNRVLRLEEDKSTSQTAWQSAEEALESIDHCGFGSVNQGSNPRGDLGVADVHRGERDSLRYEEGYQQGYLAAKELMESMSSQGVTKGGHQHKTVSSPVPSFGCVGTDPEDRSPRTPPANPNRTSSIAYNTTPQGTPVPREPHPDERRSSQIEISWNGPANAGGNDPVLSPTLPALPGIRGGLGACVPSPPPPPQYPPSPPHHESRASMLPELPEATEGGRDPFAPGDRVYWQLPQLAAPSEEVDPATRAADWIEVLGPLMSDLTVMSGVWWQRVLAESQAWYVKWVQAPAVERGLIRPSQSLELQEMRFRRLESRAYAMLQSAVPSMIRDELVANREVHCVALIFHVLRVYQPGGLQERTTLLESLSNPGVSTLASDAVVRLRAWGRALARASTMQISIPDASLMLRGLDGLSEQILKRHPHVNFRCSQARNSLQLDHYPTLSAVQEYAKILQSEFDMVAISGSASDGGPKKPKLAAVQQQQQDQGKGKGKEGKVGDSKGKGAKGDGDVPKNNNDASFSNKEGSAKGEGKTCGFYLTPKGCSKGRACTFRHSFATAKGESRCYNCGSTEHRQNDCTRPQGPTPQGKGGGENRPKGGNKGSSGAPASSPAGASQELSSNVTPAASPTTTNPPTVPTPNPKSSNDSSSSASAGRGANAPGGVPSVASAQAQVLEEAQKLLKSLRIAAIRVEDGQDASLGRVPERETDEGTNLETEEVRKRGVDIRSDVYVTSVSVRRTKLPTGLLDGGATHPLRQAIGYEWHQATPTRVALAVGSQDLRMSPLGTVLTEEPTSPICPLGLMVEALGCRVTWDAGQCVVTHPTKGVLDVWLEGNCPTVSEADCLSLIRELEQLKVGRLQQALQLCALSTGVTLEESGPSTVSERLSMDLMKWMKERLSQCPDWLIVRSLPVPNLVYSDTPYHIPGLNRRARKSLQRAKHIVLHLFSGRTRPLEFQLGKGTVLVNVDALCNRDILDEQVYAALIALCTTGRVDAVIGGPPCGTNSPLREHGRIEGVGDGGPRPTRGRTGMLRFGLPSNEVPEQRQVEDHSTLVTRFLVVHRAAEMYNPSGTLGAMENPEDPHEYLPEHRTNPEQPSIWAWPELQSLVRDQEQDGRSMGAAMSNEQDSSAASVWRLAHFDQGCLGHERRKPSVILTNSWSLYCNLHERRGPGVGGSVGLARTLPERIRQSAAWAKWSPGLCLEIGKAIREWVGTTVTEREEGEREGRIALQVLTAQEREFRKHCEEGHLVFRRDCRACLEGQMRSHVHRRQKHHGSNTFCLSMDLVGPWRPGKDHVLGRPATRFLIASLSIPLLDGSEEEGIPGQTGDASVSAEPVSEVELEEYEEGEEEEDREAESDPGPEEMNRRQREGEEAWRRTAAQLQDPVPVHDLIFCEPLSSKRSAEVLRAVQRIWVRILGLGLTVRRLHTDGGREFCNRQLDAWALARDLPHTYSVPSDPKSNGRIENWVKHAKSGVRTLLCSKKQMGTEHWPSALRQWAEQRLRKSLKTLHVPDPIRPLPPFGTEVVVKNRQWTRKTPHDAKAMSGRVACPAANIPNASVLVLSNGQFYVAPVVYQGVSEPESFHGHVADEIPPAPPRRIRGKTSVARGESGLDLLDEGLGNAAGSGSGLPLEGVRSTVSVEGLGDPGSGGEGCDEGHDEFEGMVPDSVLFDGVEDSEIHASLRNLWSEPMVCKLCEAARTSSWISDRCDSCGTWQGRMLTVKESEQEAERLLAREGFVSRCDLNQLLATSLGSWTATTRACDREAGNMGSSGLTLGMYVYGPKVGLTRSCLQRPNLTKLLNRYLKQNTAQASWTALRVTCNFEASPHRDRNAPGSMNIVAPISWFKEGKIWVEGSMPQGHEGQQVIKEYRKKQLPGYHVGGAHEVAQFDPSKAHAVEPSIGDRRVLVAYSPRLIERLTPDDLQRLRDLGFSLPKDMSSTQKANQAHYTQAKGGDRQEHETNEEEGDPHLGSREEDRRLGLSPGGEGSNQPLEMAEGVVMEEGREAVGWVEAEHATVDMWEAAHDMFVQLRNVEIDARKFLHEELEIASTSGSMGDVEHILELKTWLCDLEHWLVQHDALGQLHEGLLGCEEARVLNARLRNMNLTSLGDDESYAAVDVPLSDEPLPDLEVIENDTREAAAQQWQAVPAGPLQTVTISNKEFLDNLEEWRPSAVEELGSIFDSHTALKRATQSDVDALVAAGVVVEILPAKAIFQRKAGTGRHKTRIVACGNFESGAGHRSAEKKLSHYAGALDGVAMRAQLRACGRRIAAGEHWISALADVKTAFLRAPLELPNKVIVLRPPRALIAAGLAAEGELWIANKAIYGLQASPAAWGKHRDGELQKVELRHEEISYKLEQARGDKSIWILREQPPDTAAAPLDKPPAATLGVYVDDLLACGPRPLVQALLTEIASRWTISDPKYSNEAGGFTFCGIQVEQTTTGLEIHQRSYIDALIEKYPEIEGTASQPLLKEPEEPWTREGQATLDKLRLGQKLVGEVLWVSTRTRPDIAYATSRLGQLLVKDIDYALAAGHELIRYLRATRHYKLVYGAPRESRGSVGPWQAMASNFLELFADASFCAGADRSQSGMILQWNDAPVAWLSLRQPTASLSTAEAELQAGIDCMTLAEGFTELLQELEGMSLKCVLYGDNQGAVTVLKIPQGAWRTRHLRLKASWFLQQVEDGKYPVYHVPGQFMLGDICTKTLNGQRVRELLQLMGIAIVKAEGESDSVRVKNLYADSGGVPIKDGWEASSESTSGLKNLGADSGGVSQRELIGALLESETSEGDVSSPGISDLGLLCSEAGEGAGEGPGIPDVGLLRRALRLLIGATCLKRSLGRVVITIDSEPREGVGAWVVAVLTVLGVVLLCVGVTVGLRCRRVEAPRIRSMRGDEMNESDEWSVLSGTDQGTGSVGGGNDSSPSRVEPHLGARVPQPHKLVRQQRWVYVGEPEGPVLLPTRLLQTLGTQMFT